MGTFSVPMRVGDPQGQRFEDVEALVDTGSTLTIMPASMLRRLDVEPRRRQSFRLANNEVVEREIGQTVVRLNGFEIITSVVFGDEGRFILGAVTMEDLMFNVDPIGKRLIRVEGLMMCLTGFTPICKDDDAIGTSNYDSDRLL